MGSTESNTNSVDKVDKPKVSNIFEEINDIRNMGNKREMLLSVNFGKPKEMYDNIENITQTTNGIVKKVKNKLTNKVRAMKIIKKDLIEVQEDEELILKEVALLRSFDHPSIIKLYEFYQDEKCFYLISEYCENGDLFNLIQNADYDDKLEETQVAHMIKQILSVISYCHSNGIVIRDLRPENILIESCEIHNVKNIEYLFYYLKIIDFKSSRTFKNSRILNKKVGNPYYIAPEVLKRHYNEKCDIWSCGIIMYILLAGKPPYSGNTDKEVLENVEIANFEYFDIDMADRSQECVDFLKEMLNVDYKIRPSAQEALKNKWLINNLPNENVNRIEVSQSFSNMLKNKNNDLFFQEACFSYILHHLVSKEEIKTNTSIFHLFDKDMDGRLSHEELIEGFKGFLNIKQYEKEIKNIISYIDADNSGFIEYEEFIKATVDKANIINEETISMSFKLFDKDGSGGITPQELKELLGITSKFTDKLWSKLNDDQNNPEDSEISYEKFKKMMYELIC